MYIENSLIPAHAQSKMNCGKKSSVSAPEFVWFLKKNKSIYKIPKFHFIMKFISLYYSNHECSVYIYKMKWLEESV